LGYFLVACCGLYWQRAALATTGSSSLFDLLKGARAGLVRREWKSEATAQVNGRVV